MAYEISRSPAFEKDMMIMIVPLRAIRCGILPQPRLAQPGVHYFILFYVMMIMLSTGAS